MSEAIEELETIQQKTEESMKGVTLAGLPGLLVGQKVRIKSEALTGMEGVLLRNKDNLRVVLNLDLISKSVAVEVDAAEVEPTK